MQVFAMSPLARQTIKLFGKLHKVLYRVTGSRIFSNLGRMPNLLLTATGRKSGKPRTVPLLYIETDDGYAIVASFAGAPEHPAWYRNLQKNPQATVQIEDRVIPVTASTATPDEKKRLWPRFTAMYPDYDNYEAETERHIPVVLLCVAAKT
jgi:deazaflavin-dependent oxidoreductase (nitroreductase family)